MNPLPRGREAGEPMSTYVVTGGTGGLGRSVVQHLLARGDRVAVPYRNESAWKALREAAPRDRLWGRATDVADIEEARRFVEEAHAAVGPLDGAALAAGAWLGSGPLHEAPVSEWDAMLRTNLQSVYATCRALVPRLAGRPTSVVTVGSRQVGSGGAGAAGYVVSKAAVLELTRVLALENRGSGIRFNLVAPGTIDTPANREAMPKADRSKWTPPEEIAAVIGFLLSPASAPTSGAEIPVDGRGRVTL
jgi:NAD(P)-dependent dehydrogenase (short-subunit alcohol dehydrogenase family)